MKYLLDNQMITTLPDYVISILIHCGSLPVMGALNKLEIRKFVITSVASFQLEAEVFIEFQVVFNFTVGPAVDELIL